MATLEKLEHDKVKLSVHVDAADFEAAIQKAYQKTRGKYYVPGFRKGKAPRKVIENAYGEGVFYEDAFEEVWGPAYDAALDEHSLEPVDRPSVDIEKIDRAEGVDFTAEVQLKPAVTLGEYKGIEVAVPSFAVSEEAVQARIDSELEKNARFVDVDRAVENGDRVILDYSGSVDGEKFDGGTAEKQTLVIGSHTFIPGFEEQLVGMKAGEEKDITVTFPEEYHAENLAGREAVFAVKIHSVQLKELPAADDEFAKDVSEFDTLDEYRADIRKQLEEEAAKNEQSVKENAVVRAVAEKAQVEIPECMTARQTEYMMREMDYQLQMSGMNLETYCQYLGTDIEKMRASYHDIAEDRVKGSLIIEAVAKAENIVCTEEEMNEAIKAYAEENGIDKIEDFASRLSEDDKDFFRDRKINENAVKFLVDNAVFTEKKEEEAKDEAEEKPEA